MTLNNLFIWRRCPRSSFSLLPLSLYLFPVGSPSLSWIARRWDYPVEEWLFRILSSERIPNGSLGEWLYSGHQKISDSSGWGAIKLLGYKVMCTVDKIFPYAINQTSTCNQKRNVTFYVDCNRWVEIMKNNCCPSNHMCTMAFLFSNLKKLPLTKCYSMFQ